MLRRVPWEVAGTSITTVVPPDVIAGIVIDASARQTARRGWQKLAAARSLVDEFPVLHSRIVLGTDAPTAPGAEH